MRDYPYLYSRISGILPVNGKLLYRAAPHVSETLHSMEFMNKEALRTYTALRIPQKAEDSKGQQVQKMKYDTFIQTMADLIQKYAPKMQN